MSFVKAACLAAASCLVATSPARSIVIDFDGPPGKVVAGSEPQGGSAPGTYYSGITITATNNSGGPDAAVIFDTENPSGNDDDLGTPNQSCGGPGVGNGGTCNTCGTPQSDGPNCVPLGRSLVIAENINDANNDNLVDSPDDDNGGGTLLFEFHRSVLPIDITLLDIDGETASIELQGDTLCVTVDATDLGDNSSQTLSLVGFGRFHSLEVRFSSSGAVAELEYAVPVSTVPRSWGLVKQIYR